MELRLVTDDIVDALRKAADDDDATYAMELRSRFAVLLEPVCRLMDEARARGLDITIAINRDAYGRNVVQALKIAREL